jgi:hypothetical protein
MKLALGSLLLGMGSSMLAPMVTAPPVIACADQVVCQVTSTIAGTWNVSGEASSPGYCKCNSDDNCATNHCKVTATAVAGGSYQVVGGGPCQTTAATVVIDLKNCNKAQGGTQLVYTSTDCSGTGVWMTYIKRCGAGDCGDGVCP